MKKTAYKLLRVRKDGTIGPLFINQKQRLPIGKWLEAEDHPTKGYAHRPGWHCTIKPLAPHLSLRGRTWFRVTIEDFKEHLRPQHQGGLWFLSQRIKLMKELSEQEVQEINEPKHLL